MTKSRKRWLFASGGLLIGSFVAVFNYIGYRLVEPPYSLSSAHLAWLFSVYLVGTLSSSWMSRLGDRYGRRTVMPVAVLVMGLGLGLTLADSLPVIVLGIGLVTFGFFGGHAIASGWVGKRAVKAKAQASSLYLLCVYVGASVVGSAGGLAYSWGGWSGLVALIASLLTLAMLAAARLAGTAPLAVNQPSWTAGPVSGSQTA